jgi:hypothetical protein
LDNNSSTATIWVLNGSQFITVSPSCGDPGQTITVAGYNWQAANPWGDIEVRWAGTTRRTLPRAVEWTTTISVPTGVQPGQYQITGYQKHTTGPTFRESQPRIFTVPCPKPDLTIANLQLGSQTPITAHTPITFTATISNIGNLAAVNQFYVSLYLNPPSGARTATHISADYRLPGALVGIGRLEIGENQTVLLTAAAGLPLGVHEIFAVVDSDPYPTGMINELIETNNIIGPLTVEVAEAGDGPPTPPEPGDATGVLEGEVSVESFPGGPAVEQPLVTVYVYSQTNALVAVTYSDVSGFYSFSELPAASDPAVGTPYNVTACINLDGLEYFALVSVTIFGGQTTSRNIVLEQTACWHP